MPRSVTFPLANAAFVLATLAGSTATIIPPVVDPPVDPPPSAEAWQGPGDPELAVTLRVQVRSSYAPCMVNFYTDVSGSDYATPAAYDGTSTGFNAYDAQYHRVEATVHTGDTGNYSNTDDLNYSTWKTKAFQYGFVPKHVYSDPGSYTARAYVYDADGKWGVSQPITVTVTDPVDEFTAAQTIPVASDGVFTGAPAHDEANRCTTMDQAIQRIRAIRSGSSKFRVTLKPGDEFLGGWVSLGGNDNWLRLWGGSTDSNGQCLFDTWDFSGTRATVDLNSGAGTGQSGTFLFNPNDRSSPSTIKWRGINWIGTWDAVTGTFKNTPNQANWRRYTFFSMASLGPANREYVASECDLIGFHKTCFGFSVGGSNPTEQANARATVFALSDVKFFGLGDFSCFGMWGRVGLIATSYTQPEGYANRGSGRNMVGPLQHSYVAHAFIREGGAHEMYLRACFVQHSQGWPGLNPGQLQFSMQGATRINDGSTGPTDLKRIWVCDSVFHNALGLNGATFRANSVLENCEIVRTTFSADPEVVRGVRSWTTVRNCHLLVPNISTALTTANLSGRNADWFLDSPNASINPDFRADRPIWHTGDEFTNTLGGELQFLYNTTVNLRSAANGTNNFFKFTVRSGDAFTIVDHGSLDYAPNLSPPVLPSAGVVRLPTTAIMPDGHFRMSFEFMRYVTTSEVAIGASTPQIPYGEDWYDNPLTASSFANSWNRHTVTMHSGSTATYTPPRNVMSAVDWQNDQLDGANTDTDPAIVVTFNTSGFVIQNISPRAWPANRMLTMYLDRGTSLMAADFHPSLQFPDNTQGLYRTSEPVAPSGARSCLFAIDRSFRPGGTKGNTSGTPFAGAVPVA